MALLWPSPSPFFLGPRWPPPAPFFLLFPSVRLSSCCSPVLPGRPWHGALPPSLRPFRLSFVPFALRSLAARLPGLPVSSLLPDVPAIFHANPNDLVAPWPAVPPPPPHPPCVFFLPTLTTHTLPRAFFFAFSLFLSAQTVTQNRDTHLVASPSALVLFIPFLPHIVTPSP